jgi:hypothetical protein
MNSCTSWRAAACLVAGSLLGSGAHATDSLYAIGADDSGTGRVLTPVGPSGAGAGVALGDGSVAFNGGLAWSASDGKLYTIANDSTGASYLTSLDPAAPTALSPLVSLGFGFQGGLASDGSGLFALGTDADGNSALYGVSDSGATLLGALGAGFGGGLTYDSVDHDFYAISADDSFEPRRLSRIDLSGGAPVVTTVFDLGDGSLGFIGGLAFDATDDTFMTIGGDGVDPSSLYSFSLTDDGGLNVVSALDGGFYSAGLAFVSTDVVVPPPSIPEPPAALLLALAGAAMLIRAHVRGGASHHDAS